MIKVGILPAPGTPLIKALKIVKRNKLDVLEWHIGISNDLNKETIKEARKYNVIKQIHMPFFEVIWSYYTPHIERKIIEDHIRFIDFASDIQARQLTIHFPQISYFRLDQKYELLSKFAQNLKKIYPRAVRGGLIVSGEILEGLSVTEALKFKMDYNFPKMKFTYDLEHLCNYYDRINPILQDILFLDDEISDVHITKLFTSRKKNALITQKYGEFKKVIKLLKFLGYDGTIICEDPNLERSLKVAKKIKRLVEK